MTIKENLIIRQGCTLSLPLAVAEAPQENEAASLMNVFYDKIAHEILAYTTDPESCIRRYRSEFDFRKENSTLRINIRLTVRKTDKLSTTVVLKRSIFNLWRGEKLDVFHVSEG